jgi:bifunctional DNA-binding transcriptional regulator/antitoxin component of YhaV-PrlF toxin-antitoxin module
MEKADVVVMSSKGQVVIPQSLRQKMEIEAKSKLLIYPYYDALIIKKLEVKNAEKQLEAIYKRVRARRSKYCELGEDEINEIVQRYRHGRR